MLASVLFSAFAASLATAAPSLDLWLPRSLTDVTETTPFISAAWLAGWGVTNDTMSKISWGKYSMIAWSFAITTPDPSTLSLEESGASYIPSFVQQAHDHGTKAVITVGGWTGSRYFSTAVSPQNRTTFVQTVLNMVSTYKVDGVDFDWEYPGKTGIGCNLMSSSDTQNFLAFLQELRSQPDGKNLYLSAAVSPIPFPGPDGNPMTNLSDFATVLDHIAIMNYDINGQWTVDTGVGPNAPLDDSCSKYQTGSATSSVKAWSDAGIPKDKIVLGVPAYSHTYTVAPANATNNSGDLVDHPFFTKNPVASTPDECGNTQLETDTIEFADLISQGFLNSDGTPANGMKSRFDNCSQTPFLYNESKQLFVSYDDVQSFTAKGQFIAKNDLLGFAMWDLAGDYNDLLVDAITSGAGVTDNC